MDIQLVQEQLFDAVQQQRILKDMREFQGGDLPYLHSTYYEVKNVSFVVNEIEGENQLSQIIAEFTNLLDDSDRGEDDGAHHTHSAALDAVILDRNATHLGVYAVVEFPQVSIEFRLYYHYCDIDPVGPMIDGDVVLQGSGADYHYGPALAVVECDGDGDGNFVEVAYVPPSKMIITQEANSEEGEMTPIRFMIPVSIPADFRSKNLRVKVYSKQLSEIKYDNFDERLDDILDHENRNTMILTNLIIPQTDANADKYLEEKGSKTIEEEVNPEYHKTLIIKNIRVATDYDEVISLQNEGLELCCTLITPEGTVSDQDHIWKFHVLAEFGPPDDGGLEDLMFIKCLKSLGTLPSIPFFDVLHDYDLSKPEDDYSVYIAVKIGGNAHFKKLVMISCEMQHEESLELFIGAINGVFRLAPPELDKAANGHCGLLLSYDHMIPDTVPQKRELTDQPTHPRRQSVAKSRPTTEESRHGGGADAENHSEPASDEEEEEDDIYLDEEEILKQLQAQIHELEVEKKSLSSQNNELQKRAVMLMTREKALQGQSNPTGTAPGQRPPATGGAEGEDPNNANITQPVEHNLEKEKQYHDVLLLIVEERKKLNKQLKEFDQLALDLQTRLDDKEFKAKSIATSFKSFKKEILLKAENSRTGHPISKAQIQQIENSEAKHEEDLEKIRLRNISLKSLQKKLEKTLRQREQLAEGLHMIDFEQLKIENQTLNEKIEERNEELSKLKRKKTLTVQILTHIREKLRYVEQSNHALQEKLADLESFITTRRTSVTSKKLDRDTIRGENKEYKAKQGFASSDLLLVDYEKRKYQTTEMHASITELKNRYDLLAKQMQYSTGTGLYSSSGSNSKQGLLMSATGSFNNSGQQQPGGFGGLQINRGTTGFPVSR